jgi:hypothetical protein
VSPSRLRWLFRVWPPFLASGIRVTHIAPDWSGARVEALEFLADRNFSQPSMAKHRER